MVKDLIDNFKKARPKKDDLGAYTFPGYDCAKILIDAIGRAIDTAGGNMPTRRQVLEAVQSEAVRGRVSRRGSGAGRKGQHSCPPPGPSACTPKLGGHCLSDHEAA